MIELVASDNSASSGRTSGRLAPSLLAANARCVFAPAACQGGMPAQSLHPDARPASPDDYLCAGYMAFSSNTWSTDAHHGRICCAANRAPSEIMQILPPRGQAARSVRQSGTQ